MGVNDRGWVRGWRVVAIVALLMLVVAACGGSSGDDEETDAFPPYEGAEQLGSAVPPQEQLDRLNVKLSEPGASLHLTGDDLETVGAYYAEGVKDEGWTVPLTAPVTDAASVSVMHKDKQVAAVMSLTGAMAKMVEGVITSQGLEFDSSAVQDDDVVILESHFTCDEPEVQTCLDALSAATGQ